MNDDRIENEEELENTSPTETWTQVASCAYGPAADGKIERRRQGLRAQLQRERYERELKKQKSFINTFRNLFGASGS